MSRTHSSLQPSRTRLGQRGENGLEVPLPISALRGGRSMRVEGVNPSHVERLAAVVEELPPIAVHRPTMRVVDGLHRLSAAQLRGAVQVNVTFLDGDELDAFVFALEANLEPGGLPLTQPDRRSAGEHILSQRPQWSDRRIALSTGLSPKTVAGLRGRVGDRTEVRVGRDGRARPTNGARRRERLRELLLDQPHLSLRAAARMLGVSPETVRSVRASLVTEAERAKRTSLRAARAAPPQMDCAALVRWLREDPALRSSERGRALLRALQQQLELRDIWADLIQYVPPHLQDGLSAFARQNAVSWRALAEILERGMAS